jgi:hypothetical protein
MHEERQASSEWMVQSQLNNSETYHLKKGKPRNSPLSIGPKKPSDHPAEQTPNILHEKIASQAKSRFDLSIEQD